MPVYYADPWKESKYASIYGDFAGQRFRLEFDELRIVKEDDKTYNLYGYFVSASGIVRKYKPEEFYFTPQLCKIVLHSSEYEFREKVNGEWKTFTREPSCFEKFLIRCFEENPSWWLSESRALKGYINFDDGVTIAALYSGININGVPLTPSQKEVILDLNRFYEVEVTELDKTKELPDNGNKNKSFGGNKYSEEDKTLSKWNAVKKLLSEDSDSFNQNDNIFAVAAILNALKTDNPQDVEIVLRLIEVIVK